MPHKKTKTLFVPAIVERNDPLSLAQVVYNAIDTGRIAGLKTNVLVQETVVRLLYGELPFRGKSPFDLSVDLGVQK